MVSKCANPQCSAPFRYWGQGRLYRLDLSEHPGRMQAHEESGVLNAHNVEHFWLCGACAQRMSLALDRSGHLVTIPRGIPEAGLQAA